ncbi:glycosyl transferase [gamma proteobacterium HdN1]|nr:glycosyl transferase [gamma proteobacterium HdN1]
MSPSASKIGVAIVNWNSFGLLDLCLQHIDRQTVDISRVIIVDNHSASQPAQTPRSTRFETDYILLPENTGFAHANNLAIEQLKNCEWVALLNPDAFPSPTWLETLLQVAKHHPDVASFAGPTLMARNPHLLDGAGDAYHLSGLPWRAGYGQPKSTLPDSAYEIFSACAAAALYRRSALTDAGIFDEDFFCYCEDVDLGFRLRLLGHKALFVPQATAQHVGSATSGGRHSNTSLYYGHRNMVWAYVKNMPSPLFELLLPLHLLAAIVVWARFCLRGQGSIIFKAKRDAIRALPSMWRKRRSIQARRKASVREIWAVMEKGADRSHTLHSQNKLQQAKPNLGTIRAR